MWSGGGHVCHVLGSVGRDVVHHEGPRRLLQEPLGLSAAAGRHGAAVGNGDVTALRVAGDLEGTGVGHAHVSGVVDQVVGMAVGLSGELVHRGEQFLHRGVEDGGGLRGLGRLRSWSGEAARGTTVLQRSEVPQPLRCSVQYLARGAGWSGR